MFVSLDICMFHIHTKSNICVFVITDLRAEFLLNDYLSTQTDAEIDFSVTLLE